MKRILCIVMVICILSSAFCLETSSLEYYNCNNLKGYEDIKLIEDNNQIYLCGYQGDNLLINRLCPTNDNITLTCERNIDEYILINGNLSILCKDNRNNCQYIYFYGIKNDLLTSIVINVPPIPNRNSFTVCNGSVFLVDGENKHYILEYSKRGKLLDKYYYQNTVSGIISDNNENLYIISETDIYKKSYNNFDCVLTSIPSPIDFADSNILIDAHGNIYNSFEYICSSGFESTHPSVGKIGNIFYTPASGKICGYSLSDGNIECTYNLNAKQIRTYSDKVFALCNYSVYIIPKSNFEIEKEISESNISPNNESYFRTEYTVDNDKMQIRDIPASTSFSKFKKNFNLNGYRVNVYKTNGEKLGGSNNVGTAMTAVVESESERLEYELSVNGDITGEGNCNTKDRDTLADYILGITTFNGVYTYSADMNKDGRIDTIDLVLILRFIKRKKP